MTRVISLCLAVLLTAVATPSAAHDYSQGDVSIGHPWSRPTPPGIMIGVGYMTIHNTGNSDIVLKSLDTPRAARVSIHETVNQDGTMRMRPLKAGLTIPAGASIELKPMSYHLMLEQLGEPLRVGERVPLTLSFDGAPEMKVELSVDSMDGSQGEKTEHMDHGNSDQGKPDHPTADRQESHQGIKHEH